MPPLLARANTWSPGASSDRPVLLRSISSNSQSSTRCDRRALRDQLARTRSELELTRTNAALVPRNSCDVEVTFLELMIRRLDSQVLAVQETSALPCSQLGAADWVPEETGTERILTQLESKLLELRAEWLGMDTHGSIEEALPEQLSRWELMLAGFDPNSLAHKARQLHARAHALCRELHGRLQGIEAGKSEASANIGASSSSVQHTTLAAKVLELSREQQLIVEYPQSAFIQGRSGTGKTLVLVRRMLFRRQRPRGAGLTQIFLTKSSLLRDEVAVELEKASCDLRSLSWPPQGTCCLTWEQLVQLMYSSLAVSGPQHPLMGLARSWPAPRAAVDYTRFVSHYWPRLQPCQPSARQLPPQLVWAEFNTRLRPFRRAKASVGLTLSEYMEDNLAAMGIRLSTEDQHAVYGMFRQYANLKHAIHELDDVDVAVRVYLDFPIPCMDEVYIDEAQDFSPAELTVLMGLCRLEGGVTIAGDTCQTINPGSAFNFAQIIDAFCNRTEELEAALEQQSINATRRDGHTSQRRSRKTCRRNQLAEESNTLQENDVAGEINTKKETKMMRKKRLKAAAYSLGDGTPEALSKEEFDDGIDAALSSVPASTVLATTQESRSSEFPTSRTPEHQLFMLHWNYRCTAGVAALGSDVSQLLLERFPRCADRIDEETLIERMSAKPLFVELPGVDPSDAIMGTGSQRLSIVNPVRVVTLVPHDAARMRLRTQGVVGTILTVAEAKGLEYDLVVLCGFLTDCPDSMISALADEHSRESGVASLALSAQDLLYGQYANARLSLQAHGLLCRVVLAIPELKSLYVAITRARLGCVFLECKQEPGDWAALLKMWLQKGLVERWSGLREYALGVAPICESSVPCAAVSTHSERGRPANSFAETIRWLEAEISIRDGRSHKRARNALTRELGRLRDGGELDEEFRETFEMSFPSTEVDVEDWLGRGMHPSNRAAKSMSRVSGKRKGRTANVPRAPVAPPAGASMMDPETPSLVLALERRFCVEKPAEDLMLEVYALRARGMQLFSHAADNPRERWQVFFEARGTLLHAKKILHLALNTQLQRCGCQASAGAVVLDGTVSWQQQMSTVFQEGHRPMSWRGCSTLRLLRRQALWAHICSFLATTEEHDISNSLALVVELTTQCVHLKENLRKASVLAHAWHLLGRARYDAESSGKELAVQVSVQSALRIEQKLHEQLIAEVLDCWRHCVSKQQRREQQASHESKDIKQSYPRITVARCLVQLQKLANVRAELCSEAGRAFLAVRRPRLAAEAFSEAADACLHMHMFAKNHAQLGLRFMSVGQVSTVIRMSDMAAQGHSLRSGQCWLMVAVGGAQHACVNDTCAMKQAEMQFQHSKHHSVAALCAARAGCLKAALLRLHEQTTTRPCEDGGGLPLGLMCATLLHKDDRGGIDWRCT